MLASGYLASLWSWLLNVERKKAELHQKILVQLRWRLLVGEDTRCLLREIHRGKTQTERL